MYGSRDPLKPIPGFDATTVWAANRGIRTPRKQIETALPKAYGQGGRGRGNFVSPSSCRERCVREGRAFVSTTQSPT